MLAFFVFCIFGLGKHIFHLGLCRSSKGGPESKRVREFPSKHAVWGKAKRNWDMLGSKDMCPLVFSKNGNCVPVHWKVS